MRDCSSVVIVQRVQYFLWSNKRNINQGVLHQDDLPPPVCLLSRCRVTGGSGRGRAFSRQAPLRERRHVAAGPPRGDVSQVTYRGHGDTGHNQRHVMKVRTRTSEKARKSTYKGLRK